MPEYEASPTRIFPYIDRIVDTGHGKSVFLHI